MAVRVPFATVVRLFVETKPFSQNASRFWHRAPSLRRSLGFVRLRILPLTRLELNHAFLRYRRGLHLCFPPPPLLLEHLAVSERSPWRRTWQNVRQGDDEEARHDGRRKEGRCHPRPGVEVGWWHDQG